MYVFIYSITNFNKKIKLYKIIFVEKNTNFLSCINFNSKPVCKKIEGFNFHLIKKKKV